MIDRQEIIRIDKNMTIKLNYEGVNLSFEVTEWGVVHKIDRTDTEKYEYARQLNQLCEVQIRGRMTHGHCGGRHLQSSESGKFQYVSHSMEENDRGITLKIVQKSDIARLSTYFCVYKGTNTFRTWNEIENISSEEFTLEYIGTYGKLMITDPNSFAATEFWLPTNGSYCECQWSRASLATYGVFGGHNVKSFKKLCISNTGTWSTKTYLPMGALKEKNGKFTMWQIEANGSWSYELSDLYDSLTLHLNGPSFEEHNWQKTLRPGEKFETVKAAVTQGKSFNEVTANMTLYRRAITEKNRLLSPIVFNEYMYASWNSPSEKTAEKLIPAAKSFGADYYVIDCGWHDEEADPFYYIGKWQESVSRYPGGLKRTIGLIKKAGMQAGLWMEPEVIGAEGDAFQLYGKDAYFSRTGKTLGISRRYQLDFRCTEVRERLNRIIDKLVNEYGITYLKIDYNIEAGVGTDYNAESCGDGLLDHNRAYIGWLKNIRQKYPFLTIENCASGGNRMDYLTLANCDMQSTSDQIDYKVYPYIAANMFTALLPEQAAVWAYPASHADESQPDCEQVIMNMVNGLAARMHLASKLYLLNEENTELVKEAVELSKSIDGFRTISLPWFHKDRTVTMDDGHVVYGLRSGKTILVFAYRMSGEEEVKIEIDEPIRDAKIIYPKNIPTEMCCGDKIVTLKLQKKYMARIIEITCKN